MIDRASEMARDEHYCEHSQERSSCSADAIRWGTEFIAVSAVITARSPLARISSARKVSGFTRLLPIARWQQNCTYSDRIQSKRAPRPFNPCSYGSHSPFVSYLEQVALMTIAS
jgi:hypothetical protein